LPAGGHEKQRIPDHNQKIFMVLTDFVAAVDSGKNQSVHFLIFTGMPENALFFLPRNDSYKAFNIKFVIRSGVLK
jgi:hypothetical protein